MNKSYTTDLIIVGAGLAGLTLACLLEKQTSYRIIIVERELAIRQRVSAVNSLSVAVWRHLNIWNTEVLQASPYQHMCVWDHCGGEMTFDASYISDEPLGYIVQDQVLHHALLNKIKNSTQVRLLTDESCLEILQYDDQVCLQTQNSTIYAKYMIGCDGAQSWVREHMKFAMKSWSYDHIAITAQVTVEKSHRQTAWQKFTTEGPLAFLPLLDSHQSSIVWSVAPERAEALLALTEDEFARELQFSFESQLGKIQSVGPRSSFPLMMRHSKGYLENRVILCGDAAHTIHPLAGQGLNLAMQDVAGLVGAFIKIQQGDNAVRALRHYERERKAENWQMILVLEFIKRAYQIKHPAIQMMVKTGTAILNKINPIKSLILQFASGKKVYPAWLS